MHCAIDWTGWNNFVICARNYVEFVFLVRANEPGTDIISTAILAIAITAGGLGCWKLAAVVKKWRASRASSRGRS